MMARVVEMMWVTNVTATATGTGTRVMTSHSASRPMSAAAAGSYKAPKRKAMTFAAWKKFYQVLADVQV